RAMGERGGDADRGSLAARIESSLPDPLGRLEAHHVRRGQIRSAPRGGDRMTMLNVSTAPQASARRRSSLAQRMAWRTAGAVSCGIMRAVSAADRAVPGARMPP